MTDIHFAHAPIVEAIINIDIRPEGGVIAKLNDIRTAVRARYSTMRDLRAIRFAGEFKPETEPQASASEAPLGFVFHHSTAPQSFQARVSGFSFHRLAPYERWESFRDEARNLWDLFRTAIEPMEVVGCSVRYINRLDIPVGCQIGDYLRTFPETGAELPQRMPAFNMRLELLLDEFDGGILVLQEQTIPPEDPATFAVMLDNDFRVPLRPNLTDDEIWAVIESLRTAKNKAFINCLTPLMLERIR